MVVAARATESDSEKRLTRGIHHISQPFVANLATEQGGLVIGGPHGIHARGNPRVQIFQLTLGNLKTTIEVKVVGE